MTFYELFEIQSNATDLEIKDAYRRFAKQWHPDINSSPKAAEVFIFGTKVYEVLIDPQKRREYDNSLADQRSQEQNRTYTNSNQNSSNSTTSGQRKSENRTYLEYWLDNSFLIAILIFMFFYIVPFSELFNFSPCSKVKIRFSFWIAIPIIIVWIQGILIANFVAVKWFAKKTNLKKECFYGLAFPLLLCLIQIVSGYFTEWSLYRKAMAETTTKQCENYLNSCSYGIFHKEVKVLYDDLLFAEAKDSSKILNADYKVANYDAFDTYFEKFDTLGKHYKEANQLAQEAHFNEAKTSRQLRPIVRYFERFPNGVFASPMAALRDSVWDIAIERYERSAKQHSSKSAFLFFKKMLLYMRVNNCGSIGVSFGMKENFNEFKSLSKEQMQKVADYAPERKDSILYSKPDTTNVLPINKYFTAGNIKDIETDILQRIANGLGNVFGEKFFTVYRDEFGNSQTPLICFKYTVRNDRMQDMFLNAFVVHDSSLSTLPILIPYSENNKFSCWLLSISTDFKESYISIPKDKDVFPLAGKNYRPEGKTYHVTSHEDAYQQLIYSCFVDFQKNVLKELGIKE